MTIHAAQLLSQVQAWGRELAFSQIAVASVDLAHAEPGLSAWLKAGFHGSMGYMAAHGLRRARPADLVPGTVSVLTARMNYLPSQAIGAMTAEAQAMEAQGHEPLGDSGSTWQTLEWSRLGRSGEGVVSSYARGRDYHKVLRSRLQQLATRMQTAVGPFGHRVFTDSAPVLEAELAVQSGQGWRGKHTLVLNKDAGSTFFLGEIYIDLELPVSAPTGSHCGTCSACITSCPTQAIVAPYKLDARRCISYLTIENAGPVPLEFRRAVGNRIYGCDDCQLACPWNKFAQRSGLPDFDERAGLNGQQLATLMAWTEQDFLRITEGSAIRRIGFERWQRNVAVASGNALREIGLPVQDKTLVAKALRGQLQLAGDLVREHIEWALAEYTV